VRQKLRRPGRTFGIIFPDPLPRIRNFLLHSNYQSDGIISILRGYRAKMIVHLVDGTYELFRHFYGL
jgi:hypothetical protein